MGHLTTLGARTMAWPQGPNLAEQDPQNLCSENRNILSCFDKPPDGGGVPLLQRHERNIRFQVAVVDEYKALFVEYGVKPGSRNELVAVPNTLADICWRDVTVIRFVGGATLVEALIAAYVDFQEDMRQKKPNTNKRYNQVSATLNDALTDVTLLDERTPPDVLDHFISASNALRRVGAKSSFMDRFLKAPTSRRSVIRNGSMRQRSAACRRTDASQPPREKMRLTVRLIVRVATKQRTWNSSETTSTKPS